MCYFDVSLLQTRMYNLSGGLQSTLAGGNFKSGFLSGGISSTLGSLTAGWGDAGQLFTGIAGGGIGSVIGGGSFIDGAQMGAITVGLNHLGHGGFKQKDWVELTSADIKKLAKQLGQSPSGQDVIDFIKNVNTKYPKAYVTGKTLQESVSGITDDASKALGKINKITKIGNKISVSGGTKIQVMKLLSLKIKDGASFNISTLTSNKAVIDVTGIKAAFNLNRVTIKPTSVNLKIGVLSPTFELK